MEVMLHDIIAATGDRFTEWKGRREMKEKIKGFGASPRSTIGSHHNSQKF